MGREVDVTVKAPKPWPYEKAVQSAAVKLTNYSTTMGRDDLLQIGRLAVLQVLARYKPGRKHSVQWLQRVAYFSARNAMVDALRMNHGRHGSFKRSLTFISLDAPPRDTDSDSNAFHDFILGLADVSGTGPSADRLRLAADMVRLMTDGQRRAVLAVVECGSYEEAARVTGISQRRVHQILIRVRTRALSIARARGIMPARLSVRSEEVTGK